MEMKVVDLLDTFDGDSPVEDWISRVNKILELSKIKDDLTVALAVSKKLTGPVLNFYNALSDKTKYSWELLSKELINRFVNSEEHADNLIQLCNLQQGAMVAIDYATTKINLAGRTGVSIEEKILIPIIVKGLNSDTRALIATSDIDSIDKLTRVLTKLNQSSIMGKQVSAVHNGSERKINRKTHNNNDDVPTWLKPRKGHKLSKEDKARRREWAMSNGRCLFCLAKDHFLRNCPERGSKSNDDDSDVNALSIKSDDSQ